MISSESEIGFSLADLETFPGVGVGGWVAESIETKANLAQLRLELGLSLAILLKSIMLCYGIEMISGASENLIHRLKKLQTKALRL